MKTKGKMKRGFESKYWVVAVVALLAISGMAGGRGADSESESRAKADYIFLSLPGIMADDAITDYYEFATRAYELNPGDTTAGYYAGLMSLYAGAADSLGVERAMQQMADYVMSNPDDLSSGRILINAYYRFGFEERALAVWALLHENHPTRPEITYYYAQALARTGETVNFEHALALYDSLEVSQGPGLGLSSNKMRLMMMMEDTTRVIAELNRVLDAGPEVVANNIFAGDVYVALDMNDVALKYYNRACEIDSTDGSGYYSRAQFYKEAGDSASYQQDMLTALKLPTLDAEDKAEIMRDYTLTFAEDSLMGEHLNDVYKSLITMHPHQAELHRLYGGYLATKGDYVEAATQLSYANDLDPEELRQWGANISMWMLADRRDEAIKTGELALKYFPDDVDLLLQVAAVHAPVDTVSAIGYFHDALALVDSTNAYGRSYIYTAMGDMYASIDSVGRAMPYYKEAIALDPSNAMALNNLAYFMAISGGDLNRAEDMVCKSLELNPDNESAIDTYAWVLFKKKEYQRAKTEIDRALEMTVNVSAEMLEHAGDIYFMNGLPEEALEYWTEALELEPDNAKLEKKVKNKTYFFE